MLSIVVPFAFASQQVSPNRQSFEDVESSGSGSRNENVSIRGRHTLRRTLMPNDPRVGRLETDLSDASFSSTASSYSNDIVCFGRLRLGPYGDGTRAWSKANFSSLTDLCSSNGNSEGNMQGRCFPFLPLGPTTFIPPDADPPSLTDVENQIHCHSSCICKIQWEQYQLENPWIKGGVEDVPDMFLDSTLSKIRSMSISSRVQQQCYYDSPPSLEPLCIRPNDESRVRLTMTTRMRRKERIRRPGQFPNLDVPGLEDSACSASCSPATNFKCSGSSRGCVCQLSSVAIGVWNLGDCSRPKKREMIACPCNRTYVSQSCCWAENGIVREGQEFFLGVLKT
jgi:hypothetical protein